MPRTISASCLWTRSAAPVVIEKNGRPVAVVHSHEAWAEVERMKLEWLKAAMAEGVADADAGNVLEVNDVDAFVDEIMREIDEEPKTQA